MILDMDGVLDLNLLRGPALEAAEAAADSTLNAFLSLGKGPRAAFARRADRSARCQSAGSAHASASGHRLHDGIARVGRRLHRFLCRHSSCHQCRQADAARQSVAADYKHVPIGYHGRASSIQPSGVAVRRPNGQRKPASETEPSFGASRNLDFELELGVWIGPGNVQGEPIAIADAADHIAGFCLLNDWSARDVQGWEYQPLGPFLAKNFATTISPWIITPEALTPFRVAQAVRPDGDPKPMPYLWSDTDQAGGAIDPRTRSLSGDRTIESKRPIAAPSQHKFGLASLLDCGAARRASHGRRLQSPARRLVWLRHYFWPNQRCAGQPARTLGRRSRAGNLCLRRNAPFPRRWRRSYLPCPCQAGWLCHDRPWRMPRQCVTCAVAEEGYGRSCMLTLTASTFITTSSRLNMRALLVTNGSGR